MTNQNATSPEVTALRAMWDKATVEKAWKSAVRAGLQASPQFRDRVEEQAEIIEKLTPTVEEILSKYFPEFFGPQNPNEGDTKSK
jgi:hypothetical protein